MTVENHRFTAGSAADGKGSNRKAIEGNVVDALRLLAGCLLLGFVVLAAPLQVTAADPAANVDFARDIRPILSNACFSCHGPDNDARQAELRLDVRAGIHGTADEPGPVVPGDLDASELIRRINSDDPDERMPPPESNKHLSDAQIELLQQWVVAGAPWSEHWSFARPTMPELPAMPATIQSADSMSAWLDSPIDRFVLHKMSERGLGPSPRAATPTLVRRVFLDLHGLVPTREQADHWVGVLEPAAGEWNEAGYLALLDYLLASPRYGERWARPWLDLARYADTNGYEKDRDRSIWPYRDWVINAINRDMPFDEFTIDQLAGDLRPNATIDQRTATGFHRNTMLNEEGGIDPLEFRFHAMTDRVATTGTVWLGLTLGCAQCHTHKYDPVTHTEYYQFMALLNNASEPDLVHPNPQADLADSRNAKEAEKQLRELASHWPLPAANEADAANLDAKESEEQRNELVNDAYAAWLADQRSQPDWTFGRPVEATSNLPQLEILSDHSILTSGDCTKQDRFHIVLASNHSAPIRSIRLEALPDVSLPGGGPGTTFYEGTKGDFFLNEFELWQAGKQFSLENATETYSSNRFGANAVTAQMSIDKDLQTGWAVHGGQGERHVAVFNLADSIDPALPIELRMTFGRHYSSSLGRFRVSFAEKHALASKLTIEELAWLKADEKELTAEQTAEQTAGLRDAFLLQAPEVSKLADGIRKLRKQSPRISTLVMQERPSSNIRPTFRHHRGEFLQPKELVVPAVPAVLPPLEATGNKPSRLELARWLVSADNPLTSRVTVNRHWAFLFGQGIVETLDDFGLQGTPPTHPELLDWLALTFVNDGWSTKRLHRRLVLSQAYRQSSLVSATGLEQDPSNVWLSRAARFRLDAEVIRDSALVAAGVVASQVGGPSVRPLQPDGVTEVAYGKPKWTPSEGAARYRRSIYTYSKRTAPFAMLQAFGAPSGESCTARRVRSNSPLQGLTMLNDVMFVDLCRQTARSISKLPDDDSGRAREVFRRVLIRQPDPEELEAMLQFVASLRKRVADGGLNADEIMGLEAGSAQAKELSPWMLLSRAIMNLDEAVSRN
jgi:mono/diheme cytochrome c family protein